MSQYYPVFLDVRGKKCLVVGGGPTAERKVGTLLECGARVVVVSPEATPSLERLAASAQIQFVPRSYRSEDLDGVFLVIAATDAPQVNTQVYREALERRLLVNVADDPQHCNFILPSLVRRGDLTIAISTGGRSPALARHLRQELEAIIPEDYAHHLEKLASLRQRLRQRLKRPRERGVAWRWLMDQGLLGLLQEGRQEAVEELLRQAIERVSLGPEEA